MSLPLDVALRQCERHASVMLDALNQIPQPLTSALLQHASPELIRLIDQFVLRFTKLQDTLGMHVLRHTPKTRSGRHWLWRPRKVPPINLLSGSGKYWNA